MFSFAIELSNQKKKDGTHAIQLRITKDRKHKRVSIGKSVLKEQYSGVKGDWVKGNSDINEELLSLLEGASRFVDARRKKMKVVAVDHVVSWVKNKEEIDFLNFAEEEVRVYQKEDQYRTFLRYQNVVAKLKDYRYDESLYFRDLTVKFIKSYRLYLESIGNSEKTIFNDLACIRVLLNKAVEKEVISAYDNPFVALKIKAPKAKKANHFEKEELLIFEKAIPNNEKEKLAKDTFLFALYMGGLRFSDIVTLKWKSILNNQLTLDGKGVLNVHEKANKVLKAYRKKTWSTNDYVFPFILDGKEPESDEKLKRLISSKNALMNKALKEFVESTSIQKPISFYTARHTFAFLASMASKDLKSLSVVLGHTNEGQTKMYLETIKKTSEDELLKDTFYDG